MDDFTTQGRTSYVPFLGGDETSIRRDGKFRYHKVAVFLGVIVFFMFVMLLGSKLPGSDYRMLQDAIVSPICGAPTKGVEGSCYEAEFRNFINKFGKRYDTYEEYLRRFEIFRSNSMFLREKHMNVTYNMATNRFMDMLTGEFLEFYTSLRMKDLSKQGKLKAGSVRSIDWTLNNVQPSDIPTRIDWREKGCVSKVKDQEQCGSCWAFSATGALEGAVCVSQEWLPNLSEQQLVDCAFPEGNLGCNGGEPDAAFQYVLKNGGLCPESSYPYTSHELRFCAEKECSPVGAVTGFMDVPPKNDTALRAAIATYGPVSISINADPKEFHFYKNGVFNAPCGIVLDHAVLAVGYDTDAETGEDYYIVQNSWGESWGDGGFIKLLRIRNDESGETGNVGQCGMLLNPSFAYLL
eukprot:Lankesteria_metandrocarpae@DN4804_c0_g1_i1.p1